MESIQEFRPVFFEEFPPELSQEFSQRFLIDFFFKDFSGNYFTIFSRNSSRNFQRFFLKFFQKLLGIFSGKFPWIPLGRFSRKYKIFPEFLPKIHLETISGVPFEIFHSSDFFIDSSRIFFSELRSSSRVTFRIIYLSI